jgi:hypothetical protein
MATLPSPDDAAKEILTILVRGKNLRPGQVFNPAWLLLPFSKAPWQKADLDAGLQYGVQQGWFTQDCTLTDAGLAAAP